MGRQWKGTAMVDNSVVEKWNSINSADMAVSLQGILNRKINNKSMPFDFDDSIEKGIEFLEEASTGGAIICGNVETNGFTGTLSPLRWSTVVYVGIDPKTKNENEETIYQGVTKALNEYKDLLEKLQKQEQVSNKILEDAHSFFRALAEIFLREANPTTRTYSHMAK